MLIHYTLLFWFLSLGLIYSSCDTSQLSVEEPAVLVFSKTDGFYHKSIPKGQEAIFKLGGENGFQVDTTSSADAFTHDNLKEYAAIIFLNTTGDVLNERQQNVLEQFIQNNGGFVGIHSAADTEYDWEWYGRLVGAYFRDHPAVQPADLYIQDIEHPATQMLPQKWQRTDEWYNYKDFYEGIQVLITIDEGSYKGGGNGEWHPIAWYHQYDGGRAFYTGMGHTPKSYSDSLFLEHLLGGISYAVYGNDKLLKLRK